MSNELKIEIDEILAEGVQTNLTVIAHSPDEFVLDFVRIIPGANKGRVKSRIILSPEQAKRLAISLEENVGRYESTFGEIRVIPTESELQSMNFGTTCEA